jgi:hypothetical protein
MIQLGSVERTILGMVNASFEDSVLQSAMPV